MAALLGQSFRDQSPEVKLVWSRRAIRHLEALREYIDRDNPKAAVGVSQRILASVELLQKQPHMGRPGRVIGTRELVVPDSPYVIPYRVRNERLDLLAVFHGRRKWPKNL